ncbi:MAG TPA: DUF1365 domain-containing protein [Rhizomicrobium sp.]|jgi:DUF1365 family protein|nr:DUF1365 domain-containing protein [Rhizomicrobium sp.]
MNSAIYEGTVMHHRVTPTAHKFRYRVFALLIDLGELNQISSKSWLLGRNRAAPLGFRDKDHGLGEDLNGWLNRLLGERGIRADGAKRVLCYPRLFGFVFNPLSTWFCHASDGSLAAIVYEVHNTFGERHSYVLRVDASNRPIRQECEKDFYVSPFLSNDCSYRFNIRPPADDVLVAIDEKEHGARVLTAAFSGKRRELTDWNLLSVLLRHPLMTVKIVAAIHFEAVRLWLKRVPVHGHGAAAKI